MTIKVKIYRNRKMYISEANIGRGYVSLAELAALIRKGYDIIAYRQDTGEDVTARVLANILVDEPASVTKPLLDAIRSIASAAATAA